MNEAEQLDLPGLPPPIGFLFEEQYCCVDYQSSNRADGLVWAWVEKFSRTKPEMRVSIRNLKPVFNQRSL